MAYTAEFLTNYLSHSAFLSATRWRVTSAAAHLAVDRARMTRETVIGRVYIASRKEAGSPGVFSLELADGPVRRVRVRLRNEAEYSHATRALDENLILAVIGDLERDGNVHWLYDAVVLAVAGSVAEAEIALGRRPSGARLPSDDY